MRAKELAIKFGEYISEKELVADSRPAFPESDEDVEVGFSEITFNSDGLPEANGFKTVEQLYELFLEDIDYHD